MALRFNPPPNWPAPPEGFVPPAGWQPDPAWGPAPEGWQLWVEDSGSAASAPVAASGADAGWAPTQVVPTGSQVADPTGQSASAASADYTAGSLNGQLNGSAPQAASAPQAGAPYAASAPQSYSAPQTYSAPGSSPYAPGTDYAQAPTPYQGSGGGNVPGGGGWQPIDVSAGQRGNTSTPVTKKWWFWAIIAAVVLALVFGLVYALTRGGDDNAAGSSTQTATSQSGGVTSGPTAAATQDSSSPAATQHSAEAPTQDSSPEATSAGGDVGTSMNNPADPTTQQLTLAASEYDSDPNATMDVSFGAVQWDAGAAMKQAFDDMGYSSGYDEPGDGKIYIRVPVTVTYHGSGQMSSYDLSIDYVNQGNTSDAEYVYLADEFTYQDMPRDGGTVTGYFTYIISAADANSGIFAASAFYSTDEYYMAAK